MYCDLSFLSIFPSPLNTAHSMQTKTDKDLALCLACAYILVWLQIDLLWNPLILYVHWFRMTFVSIVLIPMKLWRHICWYAWPHPIWIRVACRTLIGPSRWRFEVCAWAMLQEQRWRSRWRTDRQQPEGMKLQTWHCFSRHLKVQKRTESFDAICV